MRIQVPDPCSVNALYGILAQVFDESGDLRTNAYQFDFEAVTSADPVARTGLNHLLMWLDRHGIFPRTSGPARFDGSILSLQGTTESGQGESRPEFVMPTLCIDAAGGGDWLRDGLSEWIAEKLGVSTFSAVSFTLQFRPLMALSASSHSELLLDARCASDGWFRLMAASCGPDLPSTMRRVLQTQVGDLVAMARATEACGPFLESDQTGLCYLQQLLHNLVECNLGFVTIHSGFALLRYTCNAACLMKRLELTHAFFPGFLIECGLSTDFLSSAVTLNEPESQRASIV